MRSLRAVLLVLLALVVSLGCFVGWWLVTPSDRYIRVLGYSVAKEGGEWIATSARELPRGSILADWSLTFVVNSPEHARVCRQEGRDLYDVGTPSPVTYSVSPWADACLNGRDPVFVTVTRTVRLLGIVPLYPASFSFQVLPPGIGAAPFPPPPGLRGERRPTPEPTP